MLGNIEGVSHSILGISSIQFLLYLAVANSVSYCVPSVSLEVINDINIIVALDVNGVKGAHVCSKMQ